MLTEEVLHQVPLDGAVSEVPEGNDGRDDLADAKLLHVRGKGVGGVEGAGVDLARKLAVGEHLHRQRVGGPVDPRLVENGPVEDVVVSEEVVGPAGTGLARASMGHVGKGGLWYIPQAGVVFEDVVLVQLVPGRPKDVNDNRPSQASPPAPGATCGAWAR